jgi:hypothetical protein
LRARFGSWLKRTSADSHGAMWSPMIHASSRSIRAYASARLTLWARTLLISVPRSTRPASKVSSML